MPPNRKKCWPLLDIKAPIPSSFTVIHYPSPHNYPTMQLILTLLLAGLAASLPDAVLPPKPTSSACPTICADYINSCSMMYGGCFPDPKCTGGSAWPTFTPPPCPCETKTVFKTKTDKVTITVYKTVPKGEHPHEIKTVYKTKTKKVTKTVYKTKVKKVKTVYKTVVKTKTWTKDSDDSHNNDNNNGGNNGGYGHGY
ncbi:hypothetical protein BDD12DRAFT_411134 [Trichophaea hybrida]|nr:hypothetical protein BDD12DRAFT_411134 [Trichophaea hybrida]